MEAAMELRHLRYFIAVAEEGSLTVAAEKRLHTAQPSLSRQIRDLEYEVGVPLLTRSVHGVELTPAGRAFLDHARLALTQAEAAAEAARRAAQPVKPTFAIGFLARPVRGSPDTTISASSEKKDNAACHVVMDSGADHLELFSQQGPFENGPQNQIDEEVGRGDLSLRRKCREAPKFVGLHRQLKEATHIVLRPNAQSRVHSACQIRKPTRLRNHHSEHVDDITAQGPLQQADGNTCKAFLYRDSRVYVALGLRL
jgi:hypothetical protein